MIKIYIRGDYNWIFFATAEPSEKFGEFILKDNFFKQDPSWKPLVTKEQVLEYSKKEYWEE